MTDGVPEIDVVRGSGTPEWFVEDGQIRVAVPGDVVGLAAVVDAGTDLRTLEHALQRRAATLRHTARQVERLRRADVDLEGVEAVGDEAVRTDGGAVRDSPESWNVNIGSSYPVIGQPPGTQEPTHRKVKRSIRRHREGERPAPVSLPAFLDGVSP